MHGRLFHRQVIRFVGHVAKRTTSTQKRSNPKSDTVGFLFPVVNEYALTVTMEMGHAIPGGAGGNPVFMPTGLQECF
jgi:hypothetical protein